jgi:hypothetical protein
MFWAREDQFWRESESVLNFDFKSYMFIFLGQALLSVGSLSLQPAPPGSLSLPLFFLLPPDPPTLYSFSPAGQCAHAARACAPVGPAGAPPSRCPRASPPQRRGLRSWPRRKLPLQAPETRRAFARRRLRLPPSSSRAWPPPRADVPVRATPSASTPRNRLRVGLRLAHAATRHRAASTKLAQLPRPRCHASEEPCPCSPCRPQLLARWSHRSTVATSNSSVSHSSERASPPWLSSRAVATHQTELELLVRASQDPELIVPKPPELLPGQSPPQRHPSPSPSPSQQRAPAH